MKIPDFISPALAWRVWQWDAAGLKSLNGEPWLPGKPPRAGCRASGSRTLIGIPNIPKIANIPHDAPEFKCTCGIYGSKSLDQLRRTQFWQYGSIHGEVNLWGSVVEHEQGFRAEFAYPKTLYLSAENLPFTLKQIEIRIQSLIGYGCDLFIAHDNRTIPLWHKGSGLGASGLEFLMSRGQKWYARRKRDRTLRRGDRIAVLGRGIAVVEQANGEHVYAVLWNRSSLRIRRKEIVWNECNMRWESMVLGFSDVGYSSGSLRKGQISV